MTDSRKKGAAWEAAVARHLEPHFPAAHRTRTPGAEADRGDIGGIAGWAVECKSQKVLAVPAWFRQAEAAAERCGARPVLVAKRNGSGDVGAAYAVLRFDDWIDLVTEYRAAVVADLATKEE